MSTISQLLPTRLKPKFKGSFPCSSLTIDNSQSDIISGNTYSDDICCISFNTNITDMIFTIFLLNQQSFEFKFLLFQLFDSVIVFAPNFSDQNLTTTFFEPTILFLYIFLLALLVTVKKVNYY